MQFLALLPALIALTTATPFKRNTTNPLTNFYLVTTTQSQSALNSSSLTNVSATSVYDPSEMQSQTYALRLIAAGYNSLPTFNLTNGDLVTEQYDEFIDNEALYNSTGPVATGEQLQLAPRVEAQGNLALKDGYLLTVGGEEQGWTTCEDDEGESVIYWKGSDSSCTETYIQAVPSPPY